MTGSILLVEDETLVGTLVHMNLEACGYSVCWLKHGEEAHALLRARKFDMIILDITLPGMDGLAILQALRRDRITTPVMMLTARGDVATKVGALGSGADDYLPKPFDMPELLARVQAVLRRSQGDREIPAAQLIRFGAYEINLATREALTNEGPLVLSAKEAALVRMLVRAQGQVLSRDDILDEVWGMDATPTVRTVDNFLLRLRKLFEPDPDRPVHFVTVRGVGYRFVPEP